ncbi:hypothetical protein DUNSADRAFT_662 [Dunaliella salina]|uniref:Calcineurin-like phosphoesterase domain-containing protein n=1 Tax=Dunaliella salina TaxID=3046 RepID=A0ABQ7GY06_DUNSA|nr:hypothetical protein DUNSADRAFT_662 [Dunaliella salina]|eukprot:KAF5839488.1 hypothetical protein DUNSADRAFT_662 [Dunaliella salina]
MLSRFSHHVSPGRLRLVSSQAISNFKLAAALPKKVASMAAEQQAVPAQARLAVVGDVHGHWNKDADEAALRCLKPNTVIFLGDFGEEDVELVQEVASCPLPKACILGNHDSWFHQVLVPRRKRPLPPQEQAPAKKQAEDSSVAAGVGSAQGGGDGGSDSSSDAGGLEGGPSSTAVLEEGGPHPALAPESAVQRQLAALGDAHIGYSGMAVHGGPPLSLVGARPFSKGGSSWSSIAPFIAALYGVNSSKESAERIVAAARAQHDHNLVIIGHNAPLGLGRERHDIAGVDWIQGGGDHGDPDLRLALQTMKEEGRRVALVLCGHMHHRLQGAHGKPAGRRMVAVDPTGALVLNAATVPRTLPHLPQPVSEPGSPNGTKKASPTQQQLQQQQQQRQQQELQRREAEAAGEQLSWRHFLVVDLAMTPGQEEQGMRVAEARDVWVEVCQKQQETSSRVAHEFTVASSTAGKDGIITYKLWDAFTKRYFERTVLNQ